MRNDSELASLDGDELFAGSCIVQIHLVGPVVFHHDRTRSYIHYGQRDGVPGVARSSSNNTRGVGVKGTYRETVNESYKHRPGGLRLDCVASQIRFEFCAYSREV